MSFFDQVCPFRFESRLDSIIADLHLPIFVHIMAYRRKRNPMNMVNPIFIVVIIIAAVATIFGLSQGSTWFLQANKADEVDREGMVRVPKSQRDLSAYERVRREDVIDLDGGDDGYFWMPKERRDNLIDKIGLIADANKIPNRVMARNKREGVVFTESDFLPEGSRVGLAGGIPADKQGFFVEAEKVPGLRFLKSGDRFDLILGAANKDEMSTTEYGILVGGIKAVGGIPVSSTGVRTMVRDAEMIALTNNQKMTTQGGLEMADKNARTRSLSATNNATKYESVLIAISPKEAESLAAALGQGLDVHLVTRSGRASDGSAEDDMNVAEDPLAGLIAFPGTTSRIDAFQKVEASHFADSSTGELRQYFFKPGDVQEDWILRPEQAIGRFLRRTTEPGSLLKESDFLPRGVLIQDIQAFHVISREDVADGLDSAWVGRVAVRDRKAGATLTENDFLPRGVLIQDIHAFHAVLGEDVADGLASPWVGRVVVRDKKAGATLTEEDFFPPGTLPGMAAAIPAGRMAFALETENVTGLAELSRGDRFDLLSSQVIDLTQRLKGVEVSPTLATEFSSRVMNRIVVKEATLIEKLEGQAIVAIQPGEVSAIASALAMKKPIYCVARAPQNNKSGPVEPVPSSETADKIDLGPSPLSDITLTESIIGGRRTVRAYRRAQ